MTDSKLVKAALEVAAAGFPVFPTCDKKPVWSNAELGVGRGQGGYKIASREPARVRELFKHERATEIAVPCGEGSGIAVIDVDSYKSAAARAWENDNMMWLQEARVHETRSGGHHYVFQHDPERRFPAALAPGVDVKANGGGYVCWPPTDGYKLLGRKKKPPPLPAEYDQAVSSQNGTVTMTKYEYTAPGDNAVPLRGAESSVEDDELVRRVIEADELYPALRALSWRLATRKLSAGAIAAALERIMVASVAAKADHPRHEDWVERKDKVEELALSAVEKQEAGRDELALAVEDITASMGGKSLISGETLERLVEAALPAKKPVAVPVGRARTKDWLKPESAILPRPWLVGTWMLCGQLGVLGGEGGANKSTMMLILGMSIVTGEPLLGAPVHKRGNVLIVNNEDPDSEIDRRFVGIRDALGSRNDGTYNLDTIGLPEREGETPLILARLSDSGDLEFVEEAWEWLEAQIREREYVAAMLEPMVSLVIGPIENNNTATHAVVSRLRQLAFATGCAIMVGHHTKKGSGGEDRHSAAMLRGASSLVDTARIVGLLTPMNKKEAKLLLGKEATDDMVEDICYQFRRFDVVKGNLAKRQSAIWFEVRSHMLPTSGDEIPVLNTVGVWRDLVDHIADIEASTIDPMAFRVANLLVEMMGEGEHPMSKIFKKCAHLEGWLPRCTSYSGANSEKVKMLFKNPVPSGDFHVVICDMAATYPNGMSIKRM